ncbi:MAG: leucyl aminopeptidase family protein [Wenzhouxiangellaceae bacterium]|nr:leucyl aminopeptidase family protein [Wenzhouxiangellaceae bacterium]
MFVSSADISQSTRAEDGARPVALVLLAEDELNRWLSAADPHDRKWVQGSRFKADPGSHLVVPGSDGGKKMVLVGCRRDRLLWTLADLPARLADGRYALEAGFSDPEIQSLAIGWALGHYRFDRYKSVERSGAALVVPEALQQRLEVLRDVSFRVRDLVNTPASDLGPGELANFAEALAERHAASFDVVQGEALEKGFPAIHTVGKASSRAPRLIRLEWGDPAHPKLAIVGKGVIFDSGGLNIKPGSGMVLMKKDMGGAAHALGLAELIMRLQLPVNLRLYIPAVENAIAGNAFRPSDIITTRSGTTVEVGNTDAEGRLVLADALTLAAEEGAERIIDFATLTGAARTALGEDLPPLYSRSIVQARAIQDLSFELEDPLWQMPLYPPYKQQIQPALADLSNTGTSSQGGSLTAALFLDHFVPDGIDWMHLDIYAWNVGDRPGRPAGGEAQCLRTIFAWLEQTYGSAANAG